MDVRYRHASLEDYLTSSRLDVNGLLDDGWGAKFPVKGREIQAAVLFCDISNFAGRTYDLTPVESLIYVNNFFAWITAEALRDRPGIVDKYIGDEIMVLFSTEFGSNDPFVDAIQTARFMAENDYLAFCPHVGIAAGHVVIGYVGTPVKYNCSVFGRPVALAARCAGVESERECSSHIVLPAEPWAGRSLADVFPPTRFEGRDGSMQEQPVPWEVLPPRSVSIKNMPDIEVIDVVTTGCHLPTQSAEDRARESAKGLEKEGSYVVRRYEFEDTQSNRRFQRTADAPESK